MRFYYSSNVAIMIFLEIKLSRGGWLEVH